MKPASYLILAVLILICAMIFNELERQQNERDQVKAVEINRHKRIMVESRGEDVSDFDPRKWNEDGTRISAPAVVARTTPAPAISERRQILPRATPDPVAAAQEIERKYGAAR